MPVRHLTTRCALLAAAILFADIAYLSAQQLSFFRGRRDYPMPGGASVVMTAGDLNGDGFIDVVLAPCCDKLTVLLGNGKGAFLPGPHSPSVGSAFALVSADFDGDGKLDSVAITEGIRIFHGNGNGTFQAPFGVYSSHDNERSFAVSDLNGDGIADVFFVTGRDGNNEGVALGRGDGTFLLSRFYAAGRTPLLAVPIQFNTDGKTDLAVVNEDSDSVTLLINQTGIDTIE
jgi:hypothetical protein